MGKYFGENKEINENYINNFSKNADMKKNALFYNSD